MSELDPELLKRALDRERAKREAAEKLLEDKSRDLYESFEALKNSHGQLTDALKEVKSQQAQLVQSEKLASLGTMSAGVAHEINNPLSFILSNINSMSHSVEVFQKYHHLVRTLLNESSQENRTVAAGDIQAFDAESDLGFLLEDSVDLINETKDGINRVKAIVAGLQDFARSDAGEVEDVDVNECISSTLKLAHNQIKYNMTVREDLEELPQIRGYSGKLSQVFLNLIVNASQAMTTPGNLTITTRNQGWKIEIVFEDTGSGMTEDTIENIFNPFFTTKEPGKGTGLGLSISHGIVEEHNGDISVVSEPGKGTRFTIILPLSLEVAKAS